MPTGCYIQEGVVGCCAHRVLYIGGCGGVLCPQGAIYRRNRCHQSVVGVLCSSQEITGDRSESSNKPYSLIVHYVISD